MLTWYNKKGVEHWEAIAVLILILMECSLGIATEGCLCGGLFTS